MANIVAIVGRPNVGKSTLFNRLIEERKAIMDNESGVTRDRHYGMAEWNGKHFTVIDTGGYVDGSDDIFEGAVRKQVVAALEEASVVLFMVDVAEGLHDLDKDFARVLRTINKPVFVVANKADNSQRTFLTGEFYAMGFEHVIPISSVNGSGTGELLDQVIEHFESDQEDEEEGLPKIAIMGRPNVGKSSFLNVLLGSERSIVTEIAGTTRDAINNRYKLFGKDLILIDTAGVRKKAKVHNDIEFYSVVRSIKALQDCDIAIILIDATQGLESQDMNIISLASKYKKGLMIMVNKWDLIEKETKTADEFKTAIVEKLGPLSYAPVIFTSVIKKQRVYKAIETAMEIYENRYKKVATSELNEKMLAEIERYQPPAYRGKYIKIKYITQLPTKTPTFAFFCNHPNYIKEPYRRFLENKLRSHFDFKGVPVKIVFKEK